MHTPDQTPPTAEWFLPCTLARCCSLDPNSIFCEIESQWAELALLLVTKRLVGLLRRETERGVTLDDDKAAAGEDKASRELASLEESCVGMASRLTQLDLMHARFYAFVEQGGSVWRNTQQLLSVASEAEEKQEDSGAVVGV